MKKFSTDKRARIGKTIIYWNQNNEPRLAKIETYVGKSEVWIRDIDNGNMILTRIGSMPKLPKPTVKAI